MQILRDKLKISNIIDDETVVLDIETTGVSRDHSIVLIAGLLDSDGNFIQFVLDDEKEEVLLLNELFPLINNKKIISYNGQNFDIPFLKSRYLNNNIEVFEEKEQFDIYRYLIANRTLTDIELFSLQEIEKYAGIDRYENFELSLDQEFYASLDLNNMNHKFRKHSVENIGKVCLHNKYDVINTENSLELVSRIEDSKKIVLAEKHRKLFESRNNEIKILDIILNTNVLEIVLKSDTATQDHFYSNQDYLLSISEDNISIKLSLVQGYLAPDILGHVHIMTDNKLELKDKKYQLPAHISYIYDGRFNLLEIKQLINYIFDLFII